MAQYLLLFISILFGYMNTLFLYIFFWNSVCLLGLFRVCIARIATVLIIAKACSIEQTHLLSSRLSKKRKQSWMMGPLRTGGANIPPGDRQTLNSTIKTRDMMTMKSPPDEGSQQVAMTHRACERGGEFQRNFTMRKGDPRREGGGRGGWSMGGEDDPADIPRPIQTMRI